MTFVVATKSFAFNLLVIATITKAISKPYNVASHVACDMVALIIA